MGCDIHLWIEVKRDGVWQMTALDQSKVDAALARDDYEDDEERAYEVGQAMSPWHDRAYGLFGILAGVRWHEAQIIAKPRGVPDDASAEYLALVERYNGDAHTKTWLTMADLLEYPAWHQVATVDNDYDDPVFKKRFSLWREEIKDLSDDDRKKLSRDDDEWPKAPRRALTHADLAGSFYRELMPALLNLGKPDDVRIVFFFDN